MSGLRCSPIGILLCALFLAGERRQCDAVMNHVGPRKLLTGIFQHVEHVLFCLQRKGMTLDHFVDLAADFNDRRDPSGHSDGEGMECSL